MNRNRVIPSVYEYTENGVRSYDIYSRLLKERIIFVNGEIESGMAEDIVAQLLFLEAEDSEEPLFLQIDSPGGCVISGLKIIDTMNFINNKVATIATGMAASMGFALLTSGEPGMRYALPNAQIMAHRVSSGAQGVIQDMEISFAHSKYLDNLLAEMIADNVGLTKEKYLGLVDRDKWLTSKDAIKFGKKGAIDKIIYNRASFTDE